MHRYQRLRLFAILVLAAEFLIGFGGRLTPRHEIFPFAAWLLFPVVPNQVSEYDIIIHPPGAEGPPARRFSQSGELVHSAHSIVSFELIQQLGRAQEQNDQALVGRLRHHLEASSRMHGLHYDLVRVKYLPVTRWLGGKVLSQTLLASFVAGPLEPRNSSDPKP